VANIYGTLKDDAHQIAAGLSGNIGKHARFTDNGYDKTVTDYAVLPYPGTNLFGITERWRYDNRPDLPEMGGGFIVLAQARAIMVAR
jgi:hypothetical protein